ncbi:hypothetical protein OH76DRAFT_102182 [Lentinus brumalis]|uniref:Uncharacterized protein n=1 Tax=Lentinus brumalis TaxID=2498619 RepID=A0A371CQF2_9APHY|nr:hypothetical protein OH76DRAFT_102182 [Polyporus brumalis]
MTLLCCFAWGSPDWRPVVRNLGVLPHQLRLQTYSRRTPLSASSSTHSTSTSTGCGPMAATTTLRSAPRARPISYSHYAHPGMSEAGEDYDDLLRSATFLHLLSCLVALSTTTYRASVNDPIRRSPRAFEVFVIRSCQATRSASTAFERIDVAASGAR